MGSQDPTMVDTTKLRALLAVATARPWHTDVWYGNDDGGWAAIGPHCVASEADGFDDAPESSSYDQAMADAALIAGAVNALPELLDEVERLRARKARVCIWCRGRGVDDPMSITAPTTTCLVCRGAGAVMEEENK